MKHILIVAALSQELKAIKSQIQQLQIPQLKVSYLSTGMGNYNMILHLTRFLEQHTFDFILNIGVCGYKEKQQDFFEVARIINMANQKEMLVPVLLNFGKLESIACSEVVIYDDEKLGEEQYVDMESYGFEMVCDNFSLPRAIFKVPVDKIGVETKNFDRQKSEDFLQKHIAYEKLLKRVVQYLDKNKSQVPNLERYSDHWKFTFSEKQIFKKLYFRYNSLVGNSFDTFFEKNKHVPKKVFLKQLELYLAQYLIR